MPDHLGSLALAIILFPLILWIPGMVLGQTTGVLGFRAKPASIRIALGLLLSFSVCPIAIYLLTRAGGFRLVWICYALVWAGAAILTVQNRSSIIEAFGKFRTGTKIGFGLVVAWIVLCALLEVDFVTTGQVFRDLNTMDAIAHIAFTNAITRTGLPPVNPFVYPGHSLALFYYYAWYLVCSLVDQLGGSFVTARAAVQAGTVYVGLAAAALVVAYGEFLGSRIFGGLRKFRTAIALALFAVTGLDLIPWTLTYLLKRLFDKGVGAGPSIERWNEQVTAWVGAVLMSPHHPAAMVICFTAVLLLCGLLVEGVSRRERVVLVILMSLALASAAAISAYVLLAFGAGVILWAPFALRRRWWKALIPLCVASVCGGLLYAPFALELRAASHETKLPVGLTIRAFTPIDYWLPSFIHFLKHSPASVYALRFVFLPVNYFGELGFFLVATILYWRWRKSAKQPLTPEESLLACLAAGSVLVCTFLTSTLRWNDLGWRGFLVAQFVMLLWATPVAEDLWYGLRENAVLPAKWRRLAWFCIIVGAAGSFTEIINMRVNFDGLGGPQAVADREAYIWVDEHTPTDTVLLFNPDEYIEYFNSLYAYRQTVSVGQAYGTFFSAGAEGQTTLREATDFFAGDRTADEIRAMCAQYHVGVIVVVPTDPVWRDRSSWVWRDHPSFANSLARVFIASDIQ